MTSRRNREGIDLSKISPQPVPSLDFHLLKSAIEKRSPNSRHLEDSENASSLELRLRRVIEGGWKKERHEERTSPSPYIMSVTSRAKRGKHGKWARSIDGVSPFSMFSHLFAAL